MAPVIDLAALKAAGATVAAGAEASLVDLGDGVLCMELHGKLNLLTPGALGMLQRAVGEVEERWAALVIGSEGRLFSGGADLRRFLAAAEAGQWAAVEDYLRRFQETLGALRRAARPVVAAPFRQALGGGCELVLQSPAVQAAAETFLGLVELRVGLLPAGGGCLEMVARSQPAEAGDWEALRRAFETIRWAHVSTSAVEAKALGLLRPADRVTGDAGCLLADAKAYALELARAGWSAAPSSRELQVPGDPLREQWAAELARERAEGRITAYDERLMLALAAVFTGGPGPARPASEARLLDLEREQFLSLCGEERTLARIRHMLETGKPLRN